MADFEDTEDERPTRPGAGHPKEIRDRAVEMLITGEPIAVVAKALDVPYPTVWSWNDQMSSIQRRIRAGKVKTDLKDLVTKLVRAEINSLIKQAEHSAQSDWLNKQDAGLLKDLHSAQSDIAVDLMQRVLDDANED